MVFAELNCFTLCMIEIYYGFGQKEKPALPEFRLEPGLALREVSPEPITTVLVIFAHESLQRP
jgi:hypothetical protein